MMEALEDISPKLKKISVSGDSSFKMVYAGAFRASLDNERIIKRDTSRALILVTIGLIPLAFLSFRRAWLGILSFVPAIAGTMLAVFVYALTKDSIFAVTMGFGGAQSVSPWTMECMILDHAETKGWAVAERCGLPP
jgi:predicted exporter